MLKALYLISTDQLIVKLDDPALRVSRSHRANQRFPFQRISRFIVKGEVDWSREALSACGDFGNTITTSGSNGSPKGTFRGNFTRPSYLQELFDKLHSNPKYRNNFITWQQSILDHARLVQEISQIKINPESSSGKTFLIVFEKYLWLGILPELVHFIRRRKVKILDSTVSRFEKKSLVIVYEKNCNLVESS